jgi:hypothetical protein
MRKLAVLIILSVLILSSSSQALKTFSGETVSIDLPVADDIFATGGVVNVNAPVNSIIVGGGTVNINAPVAGDVFAAGGQVLVNSDIGGKIVAWGGTLNMMGNVSTNAILVGGSVNIHPKAIVGRDAIVGGSDVRSAGKIRGNLTVSANNFYNTSSAGRINFQQIQSEGHSDIWPDIFNILVMLGYLAMGALIVRFFPASVRAVDAQIRRSPAMGALLGLVAIVVVSIFSVLVALTAIGLPLALAAIMLLVLALMTSGLYASFSLGKVILDLFKFKVSDVAAFVTGFVILNALFYMPMAGWLIKLVAIGIGTGAMINAVRKSIQMGGQEGPEGPKSPIETDQA